MSVKKPSEGNKQIKRKAKPVQLNKQRDEKRLSVAIARVRTLEEKQKGKSKTCDWMYRMGKDGKLISPHPELDQAKADLEILMFKAGVYKEAQRVYGSLQAELYKTVDENRIAVLKRAMLLMNWYPCEVLQKLNAEPNPLERHYIMVDEAEKESKRHDLSNKRADKMEEVAREKREKEKLSKQEVDDKLTIHQAARFCQCAEKTIRNRLRKVNSDGSPMLAGVIGKGRFTRIPRKSLEPYRKRVKEAPSTPW